MENGERPICGWVCNMRVRVEAAGWVMEQPPGKLGAGTQQKNTANMASRMYRVILEKTALSAGKAAVL
ncbi:hypothetical protein GCM10010841_20050 [Deinococcus aerophilus]|uniref:Uncharacterized protein n=1 Tax=Deinococcus aerophilus TaxID=522488 RepID=A0ABQ2GSQ8_9DEIO|nr:hypothetical protein GCM10010841_20050 [Deinococcus aerophilus]